MTTRLKTVLLTLCWEGINGSSYWFLFNSLLEYKRLVWNFLLIHSNWENIHLTSWVWEVSALHLHESIYLYFPKKTMVNHKMGPLRLYRLISSDLLVSFILLFGSIIALINFRPMFSAQPSLTVLDLRRMKRQQDTVSASLVDTVKH